MSIFADLKCDSVVQVSDMIRLDASKSFVSKGSADVTLIEISPESGADYVDVTGSESEDWYLDWAYATEGEKTVTVRITTDGDPISFTKTLTVVTEATDNLLSSDEDLIALESDVMKFLPSGKNSFKYLHRKAQGLILEYLNKTGHFDDDGDRLLKTAIVETEEFRAWSKYLVLKLIFFDASNQVDDIYWEKAIDYKSLEENARKRVKLPLDTDGDGEVSEAEVKRFDSIRISYE